jgi:hypothetical protein
MAKTAAGTKKDSAQTAGPTGPGGAPLLKPGTYSDGHPLDDIQYLECKLILKPDRFTSAKVFQEADTESWTDCCATI